MEWPVRGIYRFHYGRGIPAGQSYFQRTYITRSPLGYGRPRRALAVASACGNRGASSCPVGR
jgi:hypothetical protein